MEPTGLASSSTTIYVAPTMPFIASAACRLAVPSSVAFDRLADHESWVRWMPSSFRPLGRSLGPLVEGRKLRVKIAGIPFPATLRVKIVRRPEEICWSGGIKGVLLGEHRFSFVAEGADSVEVHSDETWSGFLAPLLRAGIQPKAEQIGREQLGALAAAVEIAARAPGSAPLSSS
jgi:hypothetical protein